MGGQVDHKMIKKDAQYLLHLVNDHESYNRLRAYADIRIAALRDELEIARDPRQITLLQGRIAELRRIATLRDEIRRIAEYG